MEGHDRAVGRFDPSGTADIRIIAGEHRSPGGHEPHDGAVAASVDVVARRLPEERGSVGQVGRVGAACAGDRDPGEGFGRASQAHGRRGAASAHSHDEGVAPPAARPVSGVG